MCLGLSGGARILETEILGLFHTYSIKIHRFTPTQPHLLDQNSHFQEGKGPSFQREICNVHNYQPKDIEF